MMVLFIENKSHPNLGFKRSFELPSIATKNARERRVEIFKNS
jgi:hypothetical protein